MVSLSRQGSDHLRMCYVAVEGGPSTEPCVCHALQVSIIVTKQLVTGCTHTLNGALLDLRPGLGGGWEGRGEG